MKTKYTFFLLALTVLTQAICDAKTNESIKITDPGIDCALQLKAQDFQLKSQESDEDNYGVADKSSDLKRAITLRSSDSFMIGKALEGSFELNKKSYSGMVLNAEEVSVRGKKGLILLASISIQNLQDPHSSETFQGKLLILKGEKFGSLIHNFESPAKRTETVGIICRFK